MSFKSTGIVLAEKPSIGIEPTRLYDASRFKNHGVHTNITMVQRPSGLWVRSFNGSNSDVDLGVPASLEITGGITIGAWVYPNALNVYHDIYASGNSKYQLLRIGNDGKVYFRIWDSSDTLQQVISNAALPSALRWYFLMVTFDGTIMRLCINGSEDNTTTPASGKMTINAGENKYLGCLLPTTNVLNGYLGLPFVKNYGLTAGQILKIFNNERHWFGV